MPRGMRACSSSRPSASTRAIRRMWPGLEAYPYDIEGAKALLAEAGVSDLSLRFPEPGFHAHHLGAHQGGALA